MTNINTPVGKAKMPEHFEEKYKKMSNDELIEYLVKKEKRTKFIDPFALQIVADRGLMACYIRYREN